MVISHISGQFGNILYEIACGKYFAKIHNDEFKFCIDPPSEEKYHLRVNYDYFFRLFKDNLITYEEAQKITVNDKAIEYREPYEYRRKYFNQFKFIDHEHYYIIFGTRQSTKYWADDVEFIKSIFNFDFKLPKFEFDLNNSVGMHFRTLHHFADLSRHFVYNQLYDLVKLNPQKDYLLFVDDLNMFKSLFSKVYEKLLKLKNFYLVHNDNIFIDFKLLSLCKERIIGMSTFAWWASYLSNTKTYMIKDHYLKYKNEFDNELKLKNFEII